MLEELSSPKRKPRWLVQEDGSLKLGRRISRKDPNAGSESVWLDGNTRMAVWEEAEKRGISKSTIMWEVLKEHFREK